MASGYTVDADGKRLQSWRMLLLPFAANEPLYATIDLTLPWNDPTNHKASGSRPYFYLCPSAPSKGNQTTYLAAVGADFAYTGAAPRLRSEIADGANNTLVVFDLEVQQPVPWMAPVDVSGESLLSNREIMRSHHSGIFQAAFLDGHATSLQLDVDRQVLRAMLTVAGGDSTTE